VEGFSSAELDQCFRYGVWIGENVLRANSQYLNAADLQPFGPRIIAFWPTAKVMRCAVDLNRELRGGAVEIQHIRPNWMLPAETDLRPTQPYPEQLFR
jgi:hypothetical protein